MNVKCPYCGAFAGAPCVTSTGAIKPKAHPERIAIGSTMVDDRKSLKRRFPARSRVEPTEKHPSLNSNNLRHPLSGTVIGYSRDGQCIRIIRDDSLTVSTFHHSFYKPTTKSEEACSWLNKS